VGAFPIKYGMLASRWHQRLPLRPGLRHVPQAPLHKATSTSPANGGGFAVFVAVHESLRGTLLPRANAAACPHPADADIRVLNEESGFDPKQQSIRWLRAHREDEGSIPAGASPQLTPNHRGRCSELREA
jgi:hypothetical protein